MLVPFLAGPPPEATYQKTVTISAVLQAVKVKTVGITGVLQGVGTKTAAISGVLQASPSLSVSVSGVLQTMQYLRPEADISTGTWTPSTGSDLYAMLDEVTPNDSDYIISASSPSNDTCEVRLQSLVSSSGTSFTLSYRFKKS